MKLYFQQVQGNTCIYEDILSIEQAIELELNEEYYTTKTIYQKIRFRDLLLNTIQRMKPGDFIETLGFTWGVSGLTKEEYYQLPEFQGW